MLPLITSFSFRRSSSDYEPIPSHNYPGKSQRRRLKSATAVAIGTTLLIISVVLFSKPMPEKRHHRQTIPTLFSLINPSTGELLNALNNDLYTKLSDFKVLFQDKLYLEAPQLILDRNEVAAHEKLTLSWTDGLDTAGNPVLQMDDIVLLHCGAESIHQLDHLLRKGDRKPSPLQLLNVVEAATMAELRATYPPFRTNDLTFPDFPVINYRVCQFVMLKVTERTFLAASPLLLIKQKPTGIHWALTADDPTSMIVNFVTSDLGTPIVQYQTNDGKLHNATGTSETYVASDLCHAPANLIEPGKFIHPGQLHSVRVEDLMPDHIYRYRVGVASLAGIVWSDEYQIRAPLPIGTSSFSFACYGDQGSPRQGWAIGKSWMEGMVEREGPMLRAVHHFGDLSYANGAGHVWDAWQSMIEPISTQVPYMVSVGNHEYCYFSSKIVSDPSGLRGVTHGFMPVWGNMGADSGGECGVPISKRFSMPRSDQSNKVFWYSFDMGSVHTIVLSAEHDLSMGSPQRKWLEKDLLVVDRKLTPWLVVEMHRPIYEAQAKWDQNAVAVGIRIEIEDLMYRFEVDLVLSGHYHAYFRTCDGLFRSECQKGGPMHITIGSAGADLDSEDLYSNTWTDAFIKGKFGYGRITVANETSLLFEYIKAGNTSAEGTGEVMDSVWLTRRRM